MRCAVILCLALCLFAPAVTEAGRFAPVSWYEGADGMERAVAEARQHEKPLVVYFRTDWCGYCRQFERDLLSTEEVSLFMDKLVAVVINPEAGRREANLAEMYGVRGFPAMYLHPATLERPQPIQRMMIGDGRPRLKTPVEFVQTLSRAAHR